MKHTLRFIILAFFSIGLSAQVLAAGDEPPAVAAILDAMALSGDIEGDRPQYDSIMPDGDGGATIAGLHFEVKKGKNDVSVKVAKLIISGVSKNNDGTFDYELLRAENTELHTTGDKGVSLLFRIPVSEAKEVHVLGAPAEGQPDFRVLTGSTIYKTGSAPLIQLVVGDKTYAAKDLVAKFDGDMKTGFGRWDISMGSAIIPVDAFPDEQFRKDMREHFGFEEFDISFDASVVTAPAASKANVAYAMRLTGKNIGSIEFALSLLDMPAKLMEALKDVDAQGKQKMGKIMPLLLGMKLKDLRLRFVDDQITDKLLEYAAKKQGTTADVLKANGGAMIQLGLARMNVPEFTKSVVAAYNAFVRDPKNITAQAAPQAPVAFATMMGLMSSPQAAIQALGVTVTANQ